MRKAFIALGALFFSMVVVASALGAANADEAEGITIFLQINNPHAIVSDKIVLIDGDNPEVKPIIENNRTLVPLRFLAENLHIHIQWDEAVGKAILAKEGRVVECYPDSCTVMIDNIAVELDVPAKIIAGRLYIPLRAISELFGQNVSFKKEIIMVTELDTSLQDYSPDKFIEIYSSFAEMLPPPNQQLSPTIQKLAKSTNNTVLVSIYDFSTDTSINYGGHDRFYPASLTKVLYLLSFLEETQAGNLQLQNTYTLKQADKYARGTWVGGTGTLQYQKNGNKYSYDQLLSYMISISDNVAANIILDTLGYEKINSLSKRFGLNDTMINRKYYEINSPLPANYTTVSDLNKMLVLLENRLVVNDSLSGQGITYLVQTCDKNRIARNITGDIVIANKTGTVSTLSGDMALVYFPHREPIALTIVLKNNTGINYNKADQEIGKLAQTIIEHYNCQPNYSLYINGELIADNIRLRFINSRPYIEYHHAIDRQSTEKISIGGKQFISLNSLTAGNEYSYYISKHPTPAVVIIKP